MPGLNRDLKSPGALRLKGGLFLLLALVASALLLAEGFTWQRLALLGIAVWGFCRFYYFLFHVLQGYAGRERALRRAARCPEMGAAGQGEGRVRGRGVPAPSRFATPLA